MSDLEPITRNEHFLNGTDLTPITREEHILAGEDLEPVTRHEWFLKKYRGRGGDVTIEELTVTENGTYSEEGKAYSPVTVNVDKGLEIVDIDKADIVTFSDGLALPITSGKFYINAQQDLNGYDHPWVGGSGKNKFDIEGWLKSRGASYTKTGNSYYIETALPLLTQPYQFSNTDIAVSVSIGSFAPDTATNLQLQLLDSEDNVVYQIRTNSEYQKYENIVASKIKLFWSNGGNFTLNEPQIEIGSTATSFAPYSNICPITGFSSMDIFVKQHNLLGGFSGNWQGSTLINDSGVEVTNTYMKCSSDYLPILPSTNYVFQANKTYETELTVSVAFYDENKTFISRAVGQPLVGKAIVSVAFTTPSNSKYIRFNVPLYSTDYQLEYGTEASEYETSTATYSTTFSDSCYGGYYDSVRGKLVVDKVYYQFNNSTTYTITGSARITDRWITSLTNIPNVSNSIKNFSGVISSISPQDAMYPTITVSGFCKNLSSPYPIINLNDSDSGLTASSSATDIANAVNAFLHQHTPQIVYELATPIEIDISTTCISTIEVTNNIYHNCNGETEISVIKEA